MLENAQFFHEIGEGAKGGVTYCVKVPLSEEFLLTVTDSILSDKKIELPLGISRCHSDDFYIKKVGREMALSRIAPEEFEMIKIYKISPKETVVLLKNESLNKTFYFKINSSSDKVWLLSVK